MKPFFLYFSFLLFCFLPISIGQPPDPLPLLNIGYYDCPLCLALQEVLSTYPNATFQLHCPPFEAWHADLFADLSLGASARYDLVLLDSQWLAEAVQRRLLLELTSFYEDRPELLADYYSSAFYAYAEFPPGQNRFYATPLFPDVMILAYRRDLLSSLLIDDIETWSDLVLAAEAVKSLNISGLYPFLGLWCSDFAACYDSAACSFNQIVWSFGGDIWDQATYRDDGVLQDPRNVDAIELTKQLIALGPPGGTSADFHAVTRSLCNGSVAIIAQWANLLSSVAAMPPEECPYGPSLAFTVVPGQVRHKLSLGGQGVSVNARLSPQRRQQALQVLAWLQQPQQQKRFIRLGGVSPRKSLISSGLFLNASPYAGVFSVSYPLVKDFWRLPEYLALLQIEMEYLQGAFNGSLAAADALQRMAKRQQAVIDAAYPHGPPPLNLHWERISDEALVALLVFVGLTVVLLAALCAWNFRHRAHPIVRFSSPHFMMLTISGLALLQGALLTYAQQPLTDTACQFHLWMAIVGVFLSLAPLVAKTWRVVAIWRSASLLQRKMIRNRHLFAFVALAMLVPLVVLTVWTAVDPNLAVRIDHSPEQPDYQVKCTNGNMSTYMGILIAYLGFLFISAAFLAFLTRNVYTEFNEARHISLVLYNGTMLACIFLPLIFFLTEDPTSNFLIEFGSVTAWTYLIVLLLFGPKLYKFYHSGEADQSSFAPPTPTPSFTPKSQTQTASSSLTQTHDTHETHDSSSTF